MSILALRRLRPGPVGSSDGRPPGSYFSATKAHVQSRSRPMNGVVHSGVTMVVDRRDHAAHAPPLTDHREDAPPRPCCYFVEQPWRVLRTPVVQLQSMRSRSVATAGSQVRLPRTTAAGDQSATWCRMHEIIVRLHGQVPRRLRHDLRRVRRARGHRRPRSGRNAARQDRPESPPVLQPPDQHHQRRVAARGSRLVTMHQDPRRPSRSSPSPSTSSRSH